MNKKFELPAKTTLKQNKWQFADYIENRIFQCISNLPVSILMDGVTRNKQKYQGIIIFTPDQLYFLKLVPCETGTADVLDTIISQVANEIKFHGGKLISVCTDNATNNVAALKGNAQELSNQSFIRFPCVCHTTNLAGQDVFSEKFSEISSNTLFLIEKLNDLSKFKVFTEKVPQFKEVRWFLLAECVLFILKHSNFLDTEGKKRFNYINDKYNWMYISYNLNSIKFLITKLEKNSVSIADIYLNLLF